MSENMADYDENISIDSDDDDDSDSGLTGAFSQNGKKFSSDAERRAHHNALERKRRDHIKECFNQLRDSVPTLQGEKPSRAMILKKAADYIQIMHQRKEVHNREIEHLQRQINELERAASEYGAVDSPEVKVDSESDDDNYRDDKHFHP